MGVIDIEASLHKFNAIGRNCSSTTFHAIANLILSSQRLNSRMEQEGPKILSPDGAFRDSVIYKAFDNAQRMLEEKVTEVSYSLQS